MSETPQPLATNAPSNLAPTELPIANPGTVVGPGLQQFSGAQFSRSDLTVAVGPPPHPFADKLSPEHISALIENEEAERQRAHKGDTKRMIFAGVLLLIVSGVVLGLISLLKEYPDLLKYTLTALFSFVGGIGTGLSAPKAWRSISQTH